MEPEFSNHTAQDFIRIRHELFEFSASHSLEELLQKTLDELGVLTESPIGFYHFLSSDRNTFSLQACSTRTVKEFCKAERRRMHYAIGQAGVWADCVQQQRPVIHNNYPSLPHRKGWPPGHPAVVRDLVVPIMRAGTIVAILAVGNKATEYTEKDVEIVSFLADAAHEIVERKRIEDALRKDRDTARLYLDVASVIFVALNRKGEVTLINRKGCEVLGYSEEEIVGKNWFENFIPKWLRDDLITVSKKLLNGEIQTAEHREIPILTRYGEEKMLAWHNTILRDDEGRVIGHLSSGQDITDRREIEQKLRESEDRFRILAECTSEGILLHEKGNIIDVNKAFAEMFGYKQSELIGMDAMHLIAPESIELVRSKIAKEYQRSYEAVGLRKDGSSFLMEVSARMIDFRGKRIRVVACHDISERKRAEETLRESELKYKTLTENSIAGIFIHQDDKYVYINEKFAEMHGYRSDELLGMNHYQLIHPDYRELIGGRAHKRLKGEQVPKKYEIRKLHKNRQTVWHEIMVSDPIIYKGKPGIMGLEIDVTTRKNMEDRLRQAQKMEAIGTLAGGIAHDFNNILSPLVGFAELLREDIPADSPLQENVDEILRAAFRSRDLIRQIQAFSRQSEQDLKPIRVQPIVKEIIKLLRSSIPTTIDILQDIDPNCGVIIADPTQVHQIVMNLATNAYHAMEETGGRLTVHLRQVQLKSYQSPVSELSPGDYALLIIADTGVGIEKDVMDKIFDPYFTTKETDKGTGLGLSVVQGIVDSCSGITRVYSEPGKGTEVHVYLPVMGRKTDQRRIDRGRPIQIGTERILVVDDEEAIVRMEQQMLERLGYLISISRIPCKPGPENRQNMVVARQGPDRLFKVSTDRP